MGERTSRLPKPLLPVARKPLLGHVLDSIEALRLEDPVIVTQYLAELLECYFQDENAKFIRNQGHSMAEGLLQVFDTESSAEAFLCLSSDVLISPDSTAQTIDLAKSKGTSVLLLSRLNVPGYKSWEYVVTDGILRDVRVAQKRVPVERAGLLITRDDLAIFNRAVSRPVVNYPNDHEWNSFKSGWTLLLKVLASEQALIRVRETDHQVFNYNRVEDLLYEPEWI